MIITSLPIISSIFVVMPISRGLKYPLTWGQTKGYKLQHIQNHTHRENENQEYFKNLFFMKLKRHPKWFLCSLPG